MSTQTEPAYEIRFDVGPANGSAARLVVAFDGEQEVFRDQVKTDNDRDRRRFLSRLAEQVEAEAGALEALAADLVAAADAADELLSESVGEGGGGPSNGPANQATQIVNLVREQEGVELFKDPKGEAYATFPVDGHHETLLLRHQRFRRYLSQLFFVATGGAPSGQALGDAIGTLEALALFRGEEHSVYLRIAELDGEIFIDLGDSDWSAVRISADGWSVIPNPPVRFRRARGMRPLPVPQSGGSIEELRNFLNIREEDWVLVVAWLVAALRARGPFPVLVLGGEQGTAKSTAAKVLRRLIAPGMPENRTQPRSTRDLMIAADNSWLLSFDNVSGLSVELSDALCRLATGGGFGTRQLYTDSEEFLVDAQRPVILNGIGDFVVRGDLVERSIMLALEPIPEDRRRTERNFWAAFEEACPRILGGLYSVLSSALRNLPSTRLDGHPRMADFAELAVAAEAAMGVDRGSFLERYMRNHRSADEVALEASLIGLPIVAMVTRVRAWNGTATELLELLNAGVSESTRRQRDWPESNQVLGDRLRRIAPNLRRSGIQIDFTHSEVRRIWLSLGDVEDAGDGDGAGASPGAEETPTTDLPQADRNPPRRRAHLPSDNAAASDPRHRPDANDDPSRTGPHGAHDGWREERL